MSNIVKAYETWLNGKMTGYELSRKDWAEQHNVKLSDIEWAFTAGYSCGEEQTQLNYLNSLKESRK